MTPNPSLKRSANGRPPGPGWWYTVHFHQPGLVSYEIGFIVEAVHASFPDCEAKRCIDRRNERWQRVRIEFEFRSRTFRDHGHDPAACDLFVCWEHNWPECPLEIVELRKVIDELEG